MMHVPRLSCQRVTGSYQGPWVPGFGRSVPNWNRRCGIPSQHWGEETTYFWNLLPNKIPKKGGKQHISVTTSTPQKPQPKTYFIRISPSTNQKNEKTNHPKVCKNQSLQNVDPLPSGNDCYSSLLKPWPCRSPVEIVGIYPSKMHGGSFHFANCKRLPFRVLFGDGSQRLAQRWLFRCSFLPMVPIKKRLSIPTPQLQISQLLDVPILPNLSLGSWFTLW